MVQIGFYLLAKLFSALLPPIDPNEDNFYGILGLEKSATNEQIRKAYKKTSLRLHPDKVAQRGDMDKEEAAAKYEKVQEAYGVLVNDEKREKYHALSTSSTRYRFVEHGGMANPGGLYENLTTASVVEKTRLVGMAWVIMLVILIQPILLGSKINQFLEVSGPLADTSWTVIFIPYWIFGILAIVFWCVLLYFAPSGEKNLLSMAVLEQIFWFVTVISLAQKWDGWSAPYSTVLIPLYCAVALGWMKSVLTILKIRGDVAKMVTMEYLEKEVLQGKNLDDLTSEEEMKLRKDYIIVNVPPEFEPTPIDEVTPDEKALEEQKVESSAEYEAATDIYNSTLGGLYGTVAFGVVFLILITLKLDDKIGGNWWVVFTPFLIYVIARILLAGFILACGSFPSDEIALQVNDDGEITLQGNDDAESGSSTTPFVKPQENTGAIDEVKKNGDKPKSDSSTGKNDATSTSAPTLTPAPKEESTSTPAASSNGADSKPNGDAPTSIGEDSEEEIHIDEETFRAWQNAYVEAEKSAIEAQMKAAGDCCTFTFQLIFLCLIIAKIDKNYDDIDPDDVGFNVFWILSPLFILFGCVGICCACLIYGAAPSGMDLSEQGGTSETTHNFEDPESGAPTELAPMIPEPPKESKLVASTPGPSATEQQAAPKETADRKSVV